MATHVCPEAIGFNRCRGRFLATHTPALPRLVSAVPAMAAYVPPRSLARHFAKQLCIHRLMSTCYYRDSIASICSLTCDSVSISLSDFCMFAKRAQRGTYPSPSSLSKSLERRSRTRARDSHGPRFFFLRVLFKSHLRFWLCVGFLLWDYSTRFLYNIVVSFVGLYSVFIRRFTVYIQ